MRDVTAALAGLVMLSPLDWYATCTDEPLYCCQILRKGTKKQFEPLQDPQGMLTKFGQ